VKEKIYYKVVSPDLKSLTSTPSTYRLQYVMGQFVIPKIKDTSIFVFKTLLQAERFANHYGYYYFPIFKCHGLGEHKVSIYTPWLTDVKKLLDDLKDDIPIQDQIFLNCLPPYTIGVQQLKLLEKVM
jgi:hypothetical protein